MGGYAEQMTDNNVSYNTDSAVVKLINCMSMWGNSRILKSAEVIKYLGLLVRRCIPSYTSYGSVD